MVQWLARGFCVHGMTMFVEASTLSVKGKKRSATSAVDWGRLGAFLLWLNMHPSDRTLERALYPAG